jgi:hypothetical protein
MNGDKSQIRAALFRFACRGEFPTYGEFRDSLRPGLAGWRSEWSTTLDIIAKEERSHGYPDITFVVHRKDAASPYPSRINFRESRPPDAEQLQTLLEHTDQIISLYCPLGTVNPYRRQ